MRRTLRRVGDALLWAALGAVVAPFAFAGGVALIAVLRGSDGPVLGMLLYLLSFSLYWSLAFGLAPCALLLVAWAFVAPRLRDADRSRLALVTLTAVLAVPAGIVVAMDDPRSTLDALASFAMIWIPAWIGLLLPRLVVPRLGPGAFAGRRAPRHLEPGPA